jgi:hypothetical protein
MNPTSSPKPRAASLIGGAAARRRGPSLGGWNGGTDRSQPAGASASLAGACPRPSALGPRPPSRSRNFWPRSAGYGTSSGHGRGHECEFVHHPKPRTCRLTMPPLSCPLPRSSLTRLPIKGAPPRAAGSSHLCARVAGRCLLSTSGCTRVPISPRATNRMFVATRGRSKAHCRQRV